MQSPASTFEEHIALTAATESDFEALLEMRIEAMRESLERIGRFDPARARERFRASFSAEHTRHIEMEETRAGFVAVKPQADYLLLDHLYIHPSTQGKGIGAAVLARVIEEANVKRLPIRVGALRESDSNHFYVRHGFVLVEQGEFDKRSHWPECALTLQSRGLVPASRAKPLISNVRRHEIHRVA